MIDAVLSPHALQRKYSESRCVSIPHSDTAHITHFAVWWLQRTHTFHRVMSPSTTQRLGEIFDYEKRPSQADSSRRKSLNKYDEQCSPSTSPQQLQISFYLSMETTNPPAVQVESVRRENPVQMHCMDQEDMKTLCREWNLRS